MKALLSVFALIATVGTSAAEVVRKECQTEDSVGLRYTSQAMYQAAKESDPWRGCSSGCSMASTLVDTMQATQRRFEAEGRMALLRARALEAAHCPKLADAIMNLLPVSDEDRASVAQEFERQMQKNRDELASLKAWQAEHPQCEHVRWIGPDYTKDDFSGKFEGKKGECSADGRGTAWRGTKDDLKMHDPDTNPLIGKVACADAMSKFGFGEGGYVDPKFCTATR